MVKISDVLTEENRVMVLDDNSTSGGVSGSHLVWFSGRDGEEDFCERDNLTKLKEGSIKYYLSVSQLLECWMEKYGEEEFITYSSKS